MSEGRLFGTMKCNIYLGKLIVPHEIPEGTKVEVLKVIENNSFFSGKGYVIYWDDFCFAYVVDSARVSLDI